ncbi:hypothetical protein BC939DRAFT_235422 [Gamsiella multidivaricata]|uniref:uncharacterized protein n=1 Tax=Gamsiella multidivaricata TaxID=101098 RepID=UPI002221180E|nr:uncharacterized protein BC939DRAFT_235422 [Gamsiella multidivaricata]KAI7820464.1 hypothetical protein BC939DRAFT_235422 [Gamsiella multidivaricata]
MVGYIRVSAYQDAQFARDDSLLLHIHSTQVKCTRYCFLHFSSKQPWHRSRTTTLTSTTIRMWPRGGTVALIPMPRTTMTTTTVVIEAIVGVVDMMTRQATRVSDPDSRATEIPLTAGPAIRSTIIQSMGTKRASTSLGGMARTLPIPRADMIQHSHTINSGILLSKNNSTNSNHSSKARRNTHDPLSRDRRIIIQKGARTISSPANSSRHPCNSSNNKTHSRSLLPLVVVIMEKCLLVA